MSRYIDADLMQNFLVETNDENDWLASQYNADWIYSYIESQPTADVVEVKYGEWKVDETHDYEPYCSLCGHEPIAGEKYNYCPDCGADMRGDKR